MSALAMSPARWRRRSKASLVAQVHVAENCLWASLAEAIERHDALRREGGMPSAWGGLAEEYWATAQALVAALFFLTEEPHERILQRALHTVRTGSAEGEAAS